MKFSLRTAIIFISYGFFCYSQLNDGYFDDVIAEVVARIVSYAGYLPPRLIHETTREVARNIVSCTQSGHNRPYLETQFKKSASCVYYTSLSFVNHLHNFLLNEVPHETKNYNKLHEFPRVIACLENAFRQVKKGIHINHFSFFDAFEEINSCINYALNRAKNFTSGAHGYVLGSKINKSLNKLALDLLLKCEVPVSEFIKQLAKEYQTYSHHFAFFPFIDTLEGALMDSAGSLRFNTWAAFLNPDTKGSISCYINRLLILLGFFYNEAPNVSWNNANTQVVTALNAVFRTFTTIYSENKKPSEQSFSDVENSDDEIIVIDGLQMANKEFTGVKNKTMKLLMSNDTHYRTRLIELNKNMMKIVDFLISNMGNNAENSRENFENFIEFFDHSLLECRVPMSLLFYSNEEVEEDTLPNFLRRKFQILFHGQRRKSDFFYSHRPYSIDCFKQSLINMFKELTELNKNCKDELKIFDSHITDYNYDLISRTTPEKEEFGKYILLLDQLGMATFNSFQHCMYEKVQDISLHQVAVANVLSRFQNFYKSCGAPPAMIQVNWDEFEFMPNEYP